MGQTPAGPDEPAEAGRAPTLDSDPGELGELAEVATDLAPGVLVGEYRIVARLGAGGMGTVYGAVHPIIGKRVAIKVLNQQFTHQPVTVDRFLREARAVNQIGHPNIVDIFAFGQLPDGRHYCVMEWLEGETLGDRLERGMLSRAEACTVLDEILAALAAAHAKQIVHRDLKPDNVFLVRGERLRVKLLDFGIAKLVGTVSRSKTQTGNFIGTPHYVSPEQARGLAVDGRADIYSLGAMAFELFTGRLPFEAPSVVDVVSMHLHDEPPDLASLAPVPAELDALVMSMLAKSPDERPQIEAIREILELVYLRDVAPDGTVIDTTSGQVVRISGSLAAVRVTGSIPVVRGSGEMAAMRGSGEMAALRGSGEMAALRGSGERPAVAEAATAAEPAGALAPAEMSPGGAPSLAPRRRWLAPALAAAVVAAIVAIALSRGDRATATPATPAASTTTAAAAAVPAVPVVPAVTTTATPTPTTASVEVVLRDAPTAARVRIDGVDVAITDGRAQATLAAGPHALEVSARGHATQRRTLDVVAGQAQRLELTLERARGGKSRGGPARPVDDGEGVVDPFGDP
jgi:tRNA A-37 threonylcarbamoyl transferase component Bud32